MTVLGGGAVSYELGTPVLIEGGARAMVGGKLPRVGMAQV